MNARPATARVATGLIADDDARMRRAIRSIVQDLAQEILEAEDGRAAIEAYHRHKPGWVTLDLAMSPVDGWTALREIMASDPLARILIVTAHDTKAFRGAARQAGAIGYVLKDDLSKIRDIIVPPDSR
jgi:DNA-binding NarL/FixJ family response regulator